MKHRASVIASCFLISFNGYHMPIDPTTIRRAALFVPTEHQMGVASGWSNTLYPKSRNAASKPGKQGSTFVIGEASLRRCWLARIANSFLRARRGEHVLFGLSTQRLNDMLRRLAKLPETNRHRLRHGGASADALARMDTNGR